VPAAVCVVLEESKGVRVHLSHEVISSMEGRQAAFARPREHTGGAASGRLTAFRDPRGVPDP